MKNERLGPREAHRLGQGGREGDQYVHGLAYITVRGGDADTEPGGELRVGVTTAQMGQGEQSLTAGGQTPPSGPDLPSPGSKSPGQLPQGATGQVDRRRVDKHTRLLVAAGDLGREPAYQELRRSSVPSDTYD